MTRKSSTTWDTSRTRRSATARRRGSPTGARADVTETRPSRTSRAASAETARAPRRDNSFIEVRRRHFLDRSEREHRHALTDLEPIRRQLAEVRQDISGCEEKVAELRERLKAIPETPDEAALTRRNAVEQHIPGELVRARRQREHDARRAKVQAELEQALTKLRGLRVEEARLTRMIITREQILATRVRQLHEHTLRRCGTYKHHLVRKHPDGNALIEFLDLALPTLPDWLPRHDPDTGPQPIAGRPAWSRDGHSPTRKEAHETPATSAQHRQECQPHLARQQAGLG